MEENFFPYVPKAAVSWPYFSYTICMRMLTVARKKEIKKKKSRKKNCMCLSSSKFALLAPQDTYVPGILPGDLSPL